MKPPKRSLDAVGALLVLGVALAAEPSHGELVTLKSGQTLRGTVDKDNTLVSIFDVEGLKRTILRDSKIARIDSESAEKLERFAIEQPLSVHAGAMPVAAVVTEASPWDEKGRRSFAFIKPGSSRPIRMTQAINALGPDSFGFRGVDGFWVSHMATSCLPRDTALAILAKVDQKNENERIRVLRFLIQAEWYDVARQELERLAREFPSFADREAALLGGIQESIARAELAEIGVARAAQKPREAATRLRDFPANGAPADVLVTVRDQLRELDALDAQAKELAEDLRSVAQSSEQKDGADELIVSEIVECLTAAPDEAIRRLGPFVKSRQGTPALEPGRRLALALSAWAAGPETALDSLPRARAMIAARTAVDAYLAAPAAAADERLDEALRTLGGSGNDPASAIEVELLEKLVRHAKPPLHETHSAVPGEPAVLRIRDDPNPDEPTEYAVLLPPEYVPWRAYPAVVVLHGAESPRGALEWLAVEAARRGYILIAPEYNLRGQPRDYRYTPSEHAAITLALRDAKRRFAIDSDRVFLTGQMLGGQAAFDFGLAHPDLFAGVAPISGLPAKYVWSTKANAAHVPLYVAIGDLAPTESDFVFGQLGKPLILKNYDITYVEYYKRALEPLPEEAAPLFDWMAGRKRDPAPKELDAVAAREGDDRFFGLVIRDFARGRTVEPSVADPLGRNLRPATVAYESKGLGTLLNVTTNGITRLDIWIHPSWVDVAKRFEVRVNRRAVFRGMVKADLPTLLEDLRTRGDRQQIYWFRLAVNLSSGRGGI